jgi:predicted nucleic acid-binding protein
VSANDQVPDDIYVDTNIVVAAIIAGSDNASSAQQFCTALADTRSRIYFSQIIRLEISQAILRLAASPARLPIEIRERYRLERWNVDFLVRHRWMVHGVREFERLCGEFFHVYEYPFDEEIWLRSVHIMSHYRLHSLDAIHVATAQHLGIRDFATSDADFRRVDNLHCHLIRD